MSQRFRLFAQSLPMAIQNLGRNRLRSILTMVGVTVGISSVFSMMTFGKFAEEKILQGYNELGANSLLIHGWSNWKRKATDTIDVVFDGFDEIKDLGKVKALFPEIQYLSPVLDSGSTTLHYGGNIIEKEARVIGVNADFYKINSRKVIKGRMITPFHVEGRSPVCLIGPEVESRLFKDRSPIGEILFVTSQADVSFACQVIGVLDVMLTNKDWRKPNLELVIPYTFFRMNHPSYHGNIGSFVASVNDSRHVETTSRRIQGYFKNKYASAAVFYVNSDILLLSQMRKFMKLFAILLSTIAGITLLVGGMGINNMMLVSATERLKEIGLRKALGATARSIRYQFLVESITLSAIAGFFGVLIGFCFYETAIFLTAKVVPRLHFEWICDWKALLLSLVSMLTVGVLSGMVPALKASRLDVMDALRME